jgi:hypothetical protein
VEQITESIYVGSCIQKEEDINHLKSRLVRRLPSFFSFGALGLTFYTPEAGSSGKVSVFEISVANDQGLILKA